MWPPSAAWPPWALAAVACVGRGGSVLQRHCVAAAWCWLSAAYSAPQNSADQKSLHHHYQIPRAGAKCGKLFFCRCLCLSVQCASPLFQQSFFSFLIFFILPKFLSSFIIHLEEAIHLKSFYYIPIFLDPLIKKISRSSVFSKDNKARLFVEKKR